MSVGFVGDEDILLFYELNQTLGLEGEKGLLSLEDEAEKEGTSGRASLEGQRLLSPIQGPATQTCPPGCSLPRTQQPAALGLTSHTGPTSPLAPRV